MLTLDTLNDGSATLSWPLFHFRSVQNKPGVSYLPLSKHPVC